MVTSQEKHTIPDTLTTEYQKETWTKTSITEVQTMAVGYQKNVKNPNLIIAEKASEMILKYANALGLTPVVIKRLDLIKAENLDEEEFLKNKEINV